jgi:hypothetical protein
VHATKGTVVRTTVNSPHFLDPLNSIDHAMHVPRSRSILLLPCSHARLSFSALVRSLDCDSACGCSS